MVEVYLAGNVPSKKNSRINLKSGVSIPNNKFTQWQAESILLLRQQTRVRFIKPVSIDVIVYFGTAAKADLDNRLSSILDMLVEALVIPDDKWQFVPQISLKAVHSPKQPGVFMRIAELD